VQRIGARLGYPNMPSARAIAAHFDTAKAGLIYQAMAAELKAAGFNLNLAPVVDLGFEPRNPPVTQWGRAFAPDGATVSRYAAAFIDGHRRVGVLTAAKHFPGHGSTLTDSHDRAVDITATWRPDELTPYRELARAGRLDAVMSGHLSHARLTGGLPATLSRKAVQTLLRGEIGFDGVVIADDLDMAAIRSEHSLKEAVVMAASAGDDLILLSNSRDPDPDLPIAAIGWIRQAVEAGQIPAGQIAASARRIAALKAQIGVSRAA
jgi:beta-N-acetylhexosaminidase